MGGPSRRRVPVPPVGRVWLPRPAWRRPAGGGHVLGRLKDVAFDPATGSVSQWWLSRAWLADGLDGMVSVPASAVSQDGSGISWMSTGDAVR